MNYEIKQGNCLDVLKTLKDKSVQCCITSPPYWGLRDYGTADWEGGDENCEHTISHYSDTLKPNVDRPNRNDRSKCIVCGAKRIDNQLGLEKTPEEFVNNLADVFDQVKRVLKDDGTLWLNLGDSYNGSGGQGTKPSMISKKLNDAYSSKSRNVAHLKSKDLVGIPWMVAFELRKRGWYLRQDIIWNKPNPMPESVIDRCTKSHEYIFLLSKGPKYYFDYQAIEESVSNPKRTNYTCGSPKLSSNEDRNDGDFAERSKTMTFEKRRKRSVWTVNVNSFKEAHFATYPKKLILPCVLAGTKEGDTILDPFSGAATTGLVAMENKRKYLGIELNPEYIEISKKRLSSIQQKLF